MLELKRSKTKRNQHPNYSQVARCVGWYLFSFVVSIIFWLGALVTNVPNSYFAAEWQMFLRALEQGNVHLLHLAICGCHSTAAAAADFTPKATLVKDLIALLRLELVSSLIKIQSCMLRLLLFYLSSLHFKLIFFLSFGGINHMCHNLPTSHTCTGSTRKDCETCVVLSNKSKSESHLFAFGYYIEFELKDQAESII